MSDRKCSNVFSYVSVVMQASNPSYYLHINDAVQGHRFFLHLEEKKKKKPSKALSDEMSKKHGVITWSMLARVVTCDCVNPPQQVNIVISRTGNISPLFRGANSVLVP